MTKIISNFLYAIIKTINFVYEKITKRNLTLNLKDLIEKDSYKKQTVLGEEISFFTPNIVTSWRVDTFFEKEPETIDWINNFERDDVIFWDIGANIGLYSIYAAIKFKKSNVISFEPSTSNLRVLSRNISINNLQERIKIFQMPVAEQGNSFQILDESEFIEGWSMNTFGKGIDFKGDKIISKNNYKIFGTNLDFLIENKILLIPDYIKIDVDGIEHLILKGGQNFLADSKIKSVLIEINENFKEQYDEALKVLKNSNFSIISKNKNENFSSEKFSNTFNYIFKKNK